MLLLEEHDVFVDDRIMFPERHSDVALRCGFFCDIIEAGLGSRYQLDHDSLGFVPESDRGQTEHETTTSNKQ